MAYGKLYGGPTTQHEGYAITGNEIGGSKPAY
jgi:hypothetical protein